MKELKIRRARHEDAEGIIRAHKESIIQLCSQDYTPEQIKAWSERPSRESFWRGAMDRDFLWVIVSSNEQVYGFCHLALMDEDNAEILGLYLVAEAKGRGLGRLMWENLQKVLQQHHVGRISLYSTLTSKAFYEKLGFYQYKGDDSIEMQGVDIPCIPMELILHK